MASCLPSPPPTAIDLSGLLECEPSRPGQDCEQGARGLLSRRCHHLRSTPGRLPSHCPADSLSIPFLSSWRLRSLLFAKAADPPFHTLQRGSSDHSHTLRRRGPSGTDRLVPTIFSDAVASDDEFASRTTRSSDKAASVAHSGSISRSPARRDERVRMCSVASGDHSTASILSSSTATPLYVWRATEPV